MQQDNAKKEHRKSYYRASEFRQEIMDSRKVVFERGYEIGFHTAKEYISLKKGFTSYIYAHPFSGKTAFLLDVYVHIAKKYDIVIGLYSPEAGGKVHLVSYLVQVYLGKKLHGTGQRTATDEEWGEALDFIDKHFVIMDPLVVGKEAVKFTTKEMMNQIVLAERQYKLKISLLLVDPYNMVSKDDEERKMAIADFVLSNLYFFNKVAESMDMHIQIAMHTSGESSAVVDSDTGLEYLPKPFPSKVMNGQNVYRAAQTMMALWRVPAGVHEKETGVPYPENATDFLQQKQKIFGAGEIGKFRLFYDVPAQKFYEVIDGQRFYCGEYEQYEADLKGEPKQVKNYYEPEENDIFTSALQPSKFFQEELEHDFKDIIITPGDYDESDPPF